jgi:hypothetical protein
MSRAADTLREHRLEARYGNCRCTCGLDCTTDETNRLLPNVAAIQARHDSHLAALLDAPLDREALAEVIRDWTFSGYDVSLGAADAVLALLAGPVHRAEPDAALRERIEALIARWDADRLTYPTETNENARYAEKAVEMCQRELRAALAATECTREHVT